MAEDKSKRFSKPSRQPSPHMLCLSNKTQTTQETIQRYTASPAVLQRLSRSLYNKLLAFQIQIDIMNIQIEPPSVSLRTLKESALREKALSVQITLSHNEN